MKWLFYNKGKFECPNCHEKRFVRMINEKGEFYPENVGRCDRENSCGYMYHASQYLKDNPSLTSLTQFNRVNPPHRQIINGFFSFDINLFEIHREGKNRSNNHYLSWDSAYRKDFSEYLIKDLHFNPDFIDEMMNQYKIYEVVELYNDDPIRRDIFKNRTSVIYYYVSIKGDIRAIEKIYYNGFKRSKEIPNKILNKQYAEFHQNKTREQVENLEIKWCLFGEHLVPKFTEKPIIVVEGVKTAFGMALYYPQINWLATGSSNRLIHLNFNTDHVVHFLPDAGFKKNKSYYQIWKETLKNMYGVNFRYDIFEFNDDCSSQEITNGDDILDVQLRDPERAHKIIMQILHWKTLC